MTVSGLDLPIVAVQDLVIYKAIAWRERDKADIEQLVRLHRSSIDFKYVRDRVAEFAEAIDQPERASELDALIART